MGAMLRLLLRRTYTASSDVGTLANAASIGWLASESLSVHMPQPLIAHVVVVWGWGPTLQNQLVYDVEK